MKRIYTLISAAAIAISASADTWTSIGSGEWYECLLTIFTDIAEGQHWAVDIEESNEQPGVYRMKPYAVEGNPIAALMGKLDTQTEVIVNAANPSKVYTVGDIAPYNTIIFAGLNPENGFGKADYYGTLTDGVISFPEGSFAYYNDEAGTWYRFDKGFKVILPGSEDKDYTLKLTTDHVCSDAETTVINMEAGADIATVKATFTRGKYDLADYLEYIAAKGTELSKESFEINTPTVRGIYSIFAVGLNKAGKVVAGACTYQVCDGEKDSDWAVVPNVTATFSEGFLSGYFTDIDAESLEVTLEESLTTPGRYRFEAPYGAHSAGVEIADHSATHKHYIYVNASDPTRVYVELSPLGISFTKWGAPYAYSYPAMYADADVDLSNLDAKYFGTYANGKISAPALLSWNNEPNIGFTDVTFDLEIKPGNDAIGEISSDNETDAVYFNLSGRRIARPTAPGFYIRNNTKIFIK